MIDFARGSTLGSVIPWNQDSAIGVKSVSRQCIPLSFSSIFTLYICENDLKYYGNYDLDSGYMFYSKLSHEAMKLFMVNLASRLKIYLTAMKFYKFSKHDKC